VDGWQATQAVRKQKSLVRDLIACEYGRRNASNFFPADETLNQWFLTFTAVSKYGHASTCQKSLKWVTSLNLNTI
jgi:hypothetical protein